MAAKDHAPRFRGLWAIPTAFVAMVVTATALAVAQLIAFSVMLGGTGPGELIAAATGWMLMLVGTFVLIGAVVIGLPTAALMHRLGAVHPGQGAMVGACMGGVLAGALSLTFFHSPAVLAFALFGVVPGAAGGAAWLWVAYKPSP